MALEFIKLVKGDSPVAQVGSLGLFKLGVESGGGGGDLTFSRVFSENTPEQISAVSAEISANNMTSAQVAETYGWNLGDTIDITLTTGEAIQMRIIGFNHDNKSDGSGKAGITLEMVNCLNAGSIMRGDGSNRGGYVSTQVFAKLRDTIKPTLPQYWQDVITKVDKKYADGGGTNFTSVYTASVDLFILSVIEYGSTSGQAVSQEGSVYEYWSSKTDADRIKTIGGTAYNWWTRSCGGNTTRMRTGTSSGGFTNFATNSSAGISFAFCI